MGLLNTLFLIMLMGLLLVLDIIFNRWSYGIPRIWMPSIKKEKQLDMISIMQQLRNYLEVDPVRLPRGHAVSAVLREIRFLP